MQKVVNFSGGLSSAYLTQYMLNEYGKDDIKIIFTNTGKECEETLQFVQDFADYYQIKIIWLEYTSEKPLFRCVDFHTASRKGEPFEAAVKKVKGLPNRQIRFCTGELKIKTVKRYMKSMGVKNWESYLGIRYDEPLRWGKILQNNGKEPFFNILPLVDLEVKKAIVNDFWAKMPFTLQLKNYQGNCDLCFLKGKNKLINLIAENPEKADWWIERERYSGSTFNKDYSVQNLKNVATSQTKIFDVSKEIDYPCFCNSD